MAKGTKKNTVQDSNQDSNQEVKQEVKEKQDTKQKTKKDTKEEVKQEVMQEVVKTDVKENDDKNLSREDKYNNLLNVVNSMHEQLTSVKNELKKYNKMVDKELTKASKGKRRRNSERTPTGFGKANVVPKPFLALLNLDETTELSRPDLTKKIYEYIDKNNLRDKENKRILRVNADLAKAFGLSEEHIKSINEATSDKKGENKGLNFSNIQKFIAAQYKGTKINYDTFYEKQVKVNTTDKVEKVEEKVEVKTLKPKTK
jgi:chromatin remodeling complex protein RSC6